MNDIRDCTNGPQCAHCTEWAQMEHRDLRSDWRGEWRKVRCPECDAHVCQDCCNKRGDGEIDCAAVPIPEVSK